VVPVVWTYVAIAIALFFAMNIGASGTAASMGAAYGSGAVRNKRIAMLLVAVGAFFGAVLGGGDCRHCPCCFDSDFVWGQSFGNSPFNQ
jgi:phosphate/sulfate permease